MPAKKEKIDDRVFGFRKQRSIIDAISKITEILDWLERKKKQLQSSLTSRKPATKSTEKKF